MFFNSTAELAKIKFLKSKKKLTLSDVLNFASLLVNLIPPLEKKVDLPVRKIFLTPL